MERLEDRVRESGRPARKGTVFMWPTSRRSAEEPTGQESGILEFWDIHKSDIQNACMEYPCTPDLGIHQFRSSVIFFHGQYPKDMYPELGWVRVVMDVRNLLRKRAGRADFVGAILSLL